MAALAHEGEYPLIYGGFAFPVGAGFAKGYLARPDAIGAFPLVLVAHGIDGLGSAEKAACRYLARNGFVAAAPDLYRNSHPEDPRQAYDTLGDDSALRDLASAGRFLAGENAPFASADTPSVLGFDIGGRLALLLAVARPVTAVAVVSAILGSDEQRAYQLADELALVGVPMLGLFGSEDALVPAQDVDAAQLAASHGTWILYEGEGHGFMDEASDEYSAGACYDGWSRILELFSLVPTSA